MYARLDSDGSLDDELTEKTQNGPIADVEFSVKRPIVQWIKPEMPQMLGFCYINFHN